jgi:5-methylcytosine-specific restriction endonuclease McrA
VVKKIKSPRKLGFVRFLWDQYRAETGQCPSVGGVSFVDIVRVVYGKELSRKQARQFLIEAWRASNMGAGEPRRERSKVNPDAAKKHITRPRRAKDDRKDFYRSEDWRKLRYLALVEHGGKCQACGASAKTGAVLHVDHIKPRSRYPELQYALSNLQVLCGDCNLGKGAWDETDWR